MAASAPVQGGDDVRPSQLFRLGDSGELDSCSELAQRSSLSAERCGQTRKSQRCRVESSNFFMKHTSSLACHRAPSSTSGAHSPPNMVVKKSFSAARLLRSVWPSSSACTGAHLESGPGPRQAAPSVSAATVLVMGRAVVSRAARFEGNVARCLSNRKSGFHHLSLLEVGEVPCPRCII